ncbi:hypothetical protein, partial [Bacillus pseudomycoides]|uniref:hypothetical protein n=1 Tax=Bacillus pseudomycoides TaxID=64104 RepID=UPI001C3F381C
LISSELRPYSLAFDFSSSGLIRICPAIKFSPLIMNELVKLIEFTKIQFYLDNYRIIIKI